MSRKTRYTITFDYSNFNKLETYAKMNNMTINKVIRDILRNITNDEYVKANEYCGKITKRNLVDRKIFTVIFNVKTDIRTLSYLETASNISCLVDTVIGYFFSGEHEIKAYVIKDDSIF